MSWDKTEGGDFGHSSRLENFVRGLNIELAGERDRQAKLQAENARLRKVAEAVADLYSDWMEYGYMDSITSRSLITVFETWKALADLDEADHD